LTVLYSFCSQANCSDGAYPQAGLIADSAGNLYGTTVSGGGPRCRNRREAGRGVVFKLAANGTETLLHAFCGRARCADGSTSFAGLVADKAGNLYGTTETGGRDDLGTVFMVAPNGTQTVLHSFIRSDGAYPAAGLIADKKGFLYGTTTLGGTNGTGTVFRIRE
jgi:uncharacterized repeat protein (TIGR03803 family)